MNLNIGPVPQVIGYDVNISKSTAHAIFARKADPTEANDVLVQVGDVFGAIQDGYIAGGWVLVETAQEGPNKETHEALATYKLPIIAEHIMPTDLSGDVVTDMARYVFVAKPSASVRLPQPDNADASGKGAYITTCVLPVVLNFGGSKFLTKQVREISDLFENYSVKLLRIATGGYGNSALIVDYDGKRGRHENLTHELGTEWNASCLGSYLQHPSRAEWAKLVSKGATQFDLIAK